MINLLDMQMFLNKEDLIENTALILRTLFLSSQLVFHLFKITSYSLLLENSRTFLMITGLLPTIALITTIYLLCTIKLDYYHTK